MGHTGTRVAAALDCCSIAGSSRGYILGILFGFVLAFSSSFCNAAGPDRIATSDRALWPYSIDSKMGFDRASRAEIIAFAHAWAANSEVRDATAWAARLAIKTADTVSIRRWQDQTSMVFVENFGKATALCQAGVDLFCPTDRLSTWADIMAYAQRQWPALPGSLSQWATGQQQFYETYLYEQLRLAALFPGITSEILSLDDSEILGTSYPDKSFLLTFDDGPTAVDGETDQLIAVLRERHLNGVFFLLGDRLKTRLGVSTPTKLKQLYDGMCIASHGRTHQPHPRMADWQESIDSANAILTSVLPSGQEAVKYFRPPYGQRTTEISEYLVKRGARDMLWNIDSQDWNAHVTAAQVTGRVVSLMLLWRRGILLFHDVHPKARQVLPAILSATEKSGIQWISCR